MKITEKRISEKLRHLGISANRLGFDYITTAIQLIETDRDYLHGITKRLYPTIAQKHNTTKSREERAIRSAIEEAYTRGNITELEKLGACNVHSYKLTNGEFLGALYECLKYEE